MRAVAAGRAPPVFVVTLQFDYGSLGWGSRRAGGNQSGGRTSASICGAQCTRSVQASVYNVVAKTWNAPSEPVNDLEQGKERAAAHAQNYLKRVGNLELPAWRWKAIRVVSIWDPVSGNHRTRDRN